MQPRIETLNEKKLVGKMIKMSLTANKTTQLWQSFMPRKKEISNALSSSLFSLQVYESGYFTTFDPHKEFEKWALTEVADFENVPDELETFVLPNGQYAVFNHSGDIAAFGKLLQYILGEWLPNSDYILDDRPHFELLGDKYKHGDPNSEEEVWIPIKINK
jgi:AraC family transcriptional regulator